MSFGRDSKTAVEHEIETRQENRAIRKVKTR
jgi:hypothetical protein